MIGSGYMRPFSLVSQVNNTIGVLWLSWCLVNRRPWVQLPAVPTQFATASSGVDVIKVFLAVKKNGIVLTGNPACGCKLASINAIDFPSMTTAAGKQNSL